MPKIIVCVKQALDVTQLKADPHHKHAQDILGFDVKRLRQMGRRL